MMKRTIILAAGLAGALAASADAFRWANINTLNLDGRVDTFYQTASWLDGVVPPLDGTETLNFVLTNAYNAAGELDVANNNSRYYQIQPIVLTTNATAGTRAAEPFVVKIGSIADSQPRQSLNVYGRHVVVDCPDPNGFAGPWRVLANGTSGFTFTNDGTSAPTLNYLENGYNTTVKTETETTKAVIGGLVSGGTFNKSGSGTLKVASASDLQATCKLFGGTLALGRTDADVPAALADGAVFHVDAMATDSLTTETDTDGKTRVTAWRDLADTTRTMTLSEDDAAADWSAPRLIVTNGVPLVDFGAHERQYAQNRDGKDGRDTLSSAEQAAELGRAATLSTPNASRVKSVREVFVVAEVTSDVAGNTVYFCGGNWSYGWALGTKATTPQFLGGGLTDPTVGAGKWLVDGAAKTAVDYPETRRLLVYSIKGNRTMEFTHLGGQWRDQISGSASFGGIRIGELVAYSRELTDAERLANQRYLMDKWHAGSERTSWDMGTVILRAENLSLDVGEGDVARVRRVRGTSTNFGATNARFPFSKTGDGELVLEDVYPSSLPIHVKGGSVSFTTTVDHDAVAAADAPAAGAFCHLDATKADTLLADADGGITNWTDCAGRATSMRLVSGRSAPTAVASDKVDGKTVVDFGETYVNNGAAMQLYNGESKSSEGMYDVFVVLRKCGLNSEAKIFASTGWELVGGSNAFAGQDNGAALSIGANWTANGLPTSIDSLSGETSVTNFNVYGMSVSQTPTVVNALGYWCSSGPNGGGIQVAEYIGYTRRLTDAERLQTQAYLMKKWGKGAHPDAATSSVGPIDFASGVTPTVGTDSPRTVASVTAADASATLVKTGAGLLTVGTLSNVSSVRVTDGALAVTGAQDLALDALTLDAAAFADGAAPRVSVNGTLTLAANGTLSATVPDDFAYGEWQVAAATAIAADGLATWTLSVASESGAKVRGICELEVRDGGVWFCHRRRGACLIIR